MVHCTHLVLQKARQSEGSNWVSKIQAKLKNDFDYDPVNISDMPSKIQDTLRVIALNLKAKEETGQRSEENNLAIEFIIQID